MLFFAFSDYSINKYFLFEFHSLILLFHFYIRSWWRFAPIGANEWANPRSTYIGYCWRLCSNRSTQKGDVLAIAGNGGSGHVGIVTVPNRMTTSAARYRVVQNDWGFRAGQNPTCWRYNC
ncbi:hypothetical protein FSP39_008184 [Pinctada imbricata]|uniref:Peptidase C51 domain-containing protein n=1 Tax=Pinctada imbricata TaxID=66713 RepID=A0AA88YM17_PINIB|nr:hypothetical protein FSP39_008184 [Pinctada imbricata]